MNNNETNPELRDLGTHQAGAARLHETNTVKKPVSVQPGHAPGIKSDKT